MTTRRPFAPSPLTGLLALVMTLSVGCASATTAAPPASEITGGPLAGGEAGTELEPAARPSLPIAPKVGAPSGTASPTPGHVGSAGRPPPSNPAATSPAPARKPKPFKLNLYRTGDYVSQYTLEWCVGASLQMALNMATTESHTSRASQERLWTMAQARSSSPFGGANPRGWTSALNDLGIGPYVLVSIPDYDEALRVAARAIRATKRPVGLVMWRGRHAWVMSGFESIGDPAKDADITVTGVRVLDPLYPRNSKRWGRSPKPNALLTPATLAKQFVVRDSTRVDLGVPAGYLLVLPTATSAGPTS